MSTKVTDLTALATTPEDSDELHIVDVSDTTGTAAGTSKRIDVSVLMGKAPVQSVNGATGTVVLDVGDLDDVTTSSVALRDILIADSSGNFQNSQLFNTIYTLLKLGTSTTLTDGANSNSEMELTGTTAKLKTGITELKLTETSPGDIEFVVATDSSGSTAFTAVHLDGLATANDAQFIIKDGCQLVCEGTGGAQGRITYSGAGNAALALPTSSGTIALTSDITAAPVDSVNGATGTVVLDTDDISEGSSNLYYTEARVSANSSVAANTAKTTFPGFGTTAGTALEGDTALLQLGTTSTTALAGDTTTISTAQANAITANTAKTSFPGFGTTAGTALEGDTALLQLGTTSTTALAGNTAVVLSVNSETPDGSGDVAIDLASVTTGGATLGGDISLNGHNIEYEKTGNTDHSHNGDIIKIGSGSTTQGEVCYLSAAGTWIATNANDPSTSGGCLIAIALGTDPDSDGMLLRGMYTLDHDPGTIGDELYLSASTAGDVTATAPSASGDVVRVIGYCLDSTNGQIYFNPSNDFIELA